MIMLSQVSVNAKLFVIMDMNRANRLVKRLASTLEVTETSTVGRTTTTTATATTVTETATTTAATTTTATTVAKATTTTTTATATAVTETATAATTEATGVVVTGSSKVQADVAAIDVSAVQALESSLGLIDGAELDVTEALGGTSLAVGRETDAVDASELGEVASKAVGGGVE
jgi:hypothetical protein